MKIWLLTHTEKSVRGRDAVLPLLARELSCKDEELQYQESQNGKPYLAAFPHIHPGFSHSQGLLAFCLADSPVGIDIEWTGRKRDIHAIARSTFSPVDENKLKYSADPVTLFYRMWTAKEAWLKYRGLRVWDLAQAPDYELLRSGLYQWRIHKQGLDSSQGSTEWIMSVFLDDTCSPEGGIQLPAGFKAEICQDHTS